MNKKSESETKLRSKIKTIGGMEFEISTLKFFCTKCKTVNYFYEDNLSPFHCDECDEKLKKRLS